MNNDKVFIVKMKWEEQSHYSKVKRVFFDEQNAMDFIDDIKKEDRYKDAFWIISDREIEDYEPCISDNDIELTKVEAIQGFIDKMITLGSELNWECYSYLEDKWSLYEQRRIELDN